MAIVTASKVGTFCIIVVLIVALAAAGAMERVVARWRRLVASGEALVMLHWAMRSVLHRHTAMVIEMAHDGGTFIHHRHQF